MSTYGMTMIASLLISLSLAIIISPFAYYYAWKRDCKEYGKETAHEIWRRF